MRQILLTGLILLLLIQSSSALTLGSALGVSFGKVDLKTEWKERFEGSNDDTNLDIGLSYKYNWNVDKIIIGVEFFYDFLNLKNSMDNKSFVDFRYRYGTNLNLGYDISKNISLYFVLGSGLIKYNANNNEADFIDKENKTKFRGLFGFGVGYDVSVSWKINFEYNRQTLKINLNDGLLNYHLKNTLEIFKLAIVYKF